MATCLGRPRVFAGFELGDAVVGEPAAADGEAPDLVERDQHDVRGGRREGALVRLRPGGDPIHGQVAELAVTDRPHRGNRRRVDVQADDPLVAFARRSRALALRAAGAFEAQLRDLGDGERRSFDPSHRSCEPSVPHHS